MSARRTRVYISGPYTKPDPLANTERMMAVWDELLSAGFLPLCPLWSHFQHTFRPRPYEDWIAYDLEWVAACDALVRLPGESAGADREVAEAKRLGIAVFSLDELLRDTPRSVLVIAETF